MGNCTNPTADSHKQIELCDPTKGEMQAIEGRKNEFELNVRARISKKDPAGIYDYEASKFEERNLRVTSPCSNRFLPGTLVVNSSNRIELVANKKGLHGIGPGNDFKPLLSFYRQEEGAFGLKPEQSITTDLGLWMIIRNNENKYLLKQGDVIKLGRSLLRVKDICPNQQNDKQVAVLRVKERVDSSKVEQRRPEALIPDEEVSRIEDAPESDEKMVCRVCYDGVSSRENPLVSLCTCTGSMRYVHFECLKSWMQSRVVEKKNSIYTFIGFKNLKCEICKTDYPSSIEHKGRTYSLLDLNKPNENYMVLELFSTEKESSEHNLKGLYMVSMDEGREVTIGRGKNCNILVSEVSVSRLHCKIVMKNGRYYLEDQGSKFGTLVSLCQGFLVHPGDQLELQINHIFIQVSSQKVVTDNWMCCGQQQVNEAEVNIQDLECYPNYLDTQEMRQDNQENF